MILYTLTDCREIIPALLKPNFKKLEANFPTWEKTVILDHLKFFKLLDYKKDQTLFLIPEPSPPWASDSGQTSVLSRVWAAGFQGPGPGESGTDLFLRRMRHRSRVTRPSRSSSSGVMFVWAPGEMNRSVLRETHSHTLWSSSGLIHTLLPAGTFKIKLWW